MELQQNKKALGKNFGVQRLEMAKQMKNIRQQRACAGESAGKCDAVVRIDADSVVNRGYIGNGEIGRAHV